MKEQAENYKMDYQRKSEGRAGQLSGIITLPAAGLAGLGELLEFVLPLWAASRLGLEPGLIGAILAIELTVAFCLRPVSGRLADRFDRAVLAGLGAFGFAGGLVILALAGNVVPVFVAAALMGAGSAFFWVPLRAIVAESENPKRSFASLTEAEGTGIWVVYVIALSLLPLLDYSGVYAAAAAVALGLAVYLGTAGRSRKSAATAPHVTRAEVDRERPLGRGQATRLTSFIVLVALVEAAASVYLLLRFQREFELELMQIIWFYLPGLIVYSVVPQMGAALSERAGQRTTVVISLLLSVSGVVLVTLAPQTWMLSVGWALLCWSWGWLDPLQQTTSIRVFPGGFGRSMGRYESAGLAGGAVGSLVGGIAFESDSIMAVALAAVVVSLLCLILVPGLYPAGPSPAVSGGMGGRKAPREPRKEFTKAVEHFVVYAVVQILLMLAEMSWIADWIHTGQFMGGLSDQGGTVNQMLYVGNAVWAGLVVVDLAVNGLPLLRQESENHGASSKGETTPDESETEHPEGTP
ncbi:MFS transporter [Arthrobacter sp. NIO-1057]|uniref:MFS transporter n=1 Tax=Arthrobacter sp. NIO-1057 TaxID=993071 RepID=UPI00071D8764|nr:MFS transporter [Arthrobacter sp. NIO-1057]KSU65515.1 hypothetical protein AS038_11505 [Arthrobacter sp. NIO-1057]